jgi:exosortase/archaeosortase family protein
VSAARRWIWNDAVFTGVALLLVASTYTRLAAPLNESLCDLSYRGARALLDIIGVPYTADAAKRVLARSSFALEVTGLCSGLRGIALWGAVMILLPVSRRRKLVHVAFGAVALVLVNVVRIVHLFELGAAGSPHFALLHEWIWPTAVLGAILFYRLLMLLTHRTGTAKVVYG